MSNEARDQARAVAVFRELVELLDASPFDYAVGGGISTAHWTGGADKISDVDVIVREEEAGEIMKHLSQRGYEVAEMERSWLHKAFKDSVTVDLIFELKNGTRFDDPLKEHRKQGEIFGTMAYVVAPEDQVASLAGTIDRQTVGQHWYSVIDIMASNDLDWDYVLARSQRIPLKMLSVVYFALSEQVPVQKGVIEELIEFADSPDHPTGG